MLPPRTVFLSKLIGLYCILASIAMATQRQATVDTVNSLIHDRPLLLVVGLFTLTAGLALVLAHNIWSGGATPIIITVIGWLTLIKGASILFPAPKGEMGLYFLVRYEKLFYLYMGFTFLLGMYLTWRGFRRSQ